MILELGTLRQFVDLTVQVCNLQNEEVTGLSEMVALFEYCNRNYIDPKKLLDHLKAEEAKLPPSITRHWPGARVLRFSASRDCFYSPDEEYLKDGCASEFLDKTRLDLSEAKLLRENDTRSDKEKFFKPMAQLMQEHHKRWVERRKMLERIVAYRAALNPSETTVDQEYKRFLAENSEDAL